MFSSLIRAVWNDQEHRPRMLVRLVPMAYVWVALYTSSRLLPLSYRYAMIAGGVLILVSGLALLFDRRSLLDFGFRFDRHTLADFLFGLFFGGGIVVGLFILMRAMGLIEVTGGASTLFAYASVGQAIRTMLGVYAVVAFSEEIVFRGVLIKNFAEGLNRWFPQRHRALAAVLLSALLFGYVHFDNPSATTLSNVNLVLFGLVLAIPYLMTGSLAITIAFHFSWNSTLMLLGLPVSGFTPLVSLVSVETLGTSWLGGGAFGPEGGVLGTLAVLVQGGGYLLWLRLTRGELRIWRRLGHYTPVRVFAMTPGEIREEREKLRHELDALQGIPEERV